MRLIDADKLIDRFKELKGSDTLANMFVRDVIKEINKQPNVYDVDKVVERLEQQKSQCFIRAEEIKNKFGESSETHRLISKACSYDHAIEIVKSGGISKE